MAKPLPRRVRITSNGWAAVVGASVMFAMAVQTRSVWMQVVGSALVGLLAISWLSVIRRRAGLAVTMKAPSDVVVGVPFDVALVLRNAGKQPTAPLRIRYQPIADPPLVAPAVVYADPLSPGDTTVASVSRVALRRGSVGATRIAVDTIGPFGFFTSTRLVDVARPLWAAPPPAQVIDIPQVLSTDADGSGPMGPGLDVRGVREWRPGDAVRHVHWRSTARTGRIAVLEYGEPTVDRVAVLVAGTTVEPRFEAALAVAAATARQAFYDGIAFVIAYAEAALPESSSLIGLRTNSAPVALTLLEGRRIYAALQPAVPTPSDVDEMLETLGFGGVVLLVAGAGLSYEFLSYVESAAMAAGVRVIDCAEYIGDQR